MKNLILLSFFLILYSHGKAQQTIQLSGSLPKVQTAEALAVQRYTTYPMDYSTGLANITIPLYEIKVGDITLPITLSYHSSGFRPNEATGRIATGWTLNAEPSVSKQVRGLDDGASNQIYGIYNYDPDLYKAQYGSLYYKRVADGKLDALSDVYFYKLADKTGSFVLASAGSTKQFIPQPYSDIKITGTPTSIAIEDDNGISYKFGGDNDYIERYYQSYLPVNLLCQEITSKMTKARIDFIYNSSGLVNYYYRSYVSNDVVTIAQGSTSETPILTKTIGGMKKMYMISNTGTLVETNYGTDYNPYAGEASTTATIMTQPLREIKFDNGSIIFEGDNLTTIDIWVKDKSNNIIKEINLYCSPYKPYGNTDMQHRKLDSIAIRVPGGDIQKYDFEYFESYHAPDRDSRSIDYWGFYNGIYNSNNISLVPSFSTTLNINGTDVKYEHSGMDRTPNSSATMTGVLSKITDPNGAETIFEYEGNQTGIQLKSYSPGSQLINLPSSFWLLEFEHYSPQLSIDIPVGGLRIKKITEKDPVTGKKLYREFSYGCLTEAWGDYVIPTWGVSKRLVGPNAYLLRQGSLKTWYCNPVVDITFNGGSPILYSRVTERKWGGDNDNIWTEYYYTTPKNNTFLDEEYSYVSDCYGYDYLCIYSRIKRRIDENRNTSIPFSFRHFSDEEYGKLYKKIDYVEDGTGQRIVRKEEYKNKFVRRLWVPRMWSDYVYRIGTYTPSYGQPSEDEIAKNEVFVTLDAMGDEDGHVTHNIVEKETTTEYFSAGDFVTTSKDFSYTDTKKSDSELSIRPKVRSITTQLNGNKQQEEYFTYSDGNYTLTHYPESLYPSKPFSKHPRGILTEHKVIIGNDTTYMRQNLAWVNDNFSTINSIKTKSTPGNKFDEVLSIKHNNYGNITETTGLDGIPTAYIWSYNNQYLVAKVENATFQSISDVLSTRLSLSMESVNGITDLSTRNDVSVHLESLRSLLPNAQVYTYLYKPLVGMTRATDPSGKIIYYEYDLSNRLKRTYFKEKDASNNDVERTIESYEYNFKK